MIYAELGAINKPGVYTPKSPALKKEIATLQARLAPADAALQKELGKQYQVEQQVTAALDKIAPDRERSYGGGMGPHGRSPQIWISTAEQLSAVLSQTK